MGIGLVQVGHFRVVPSVPQYCRTRHPGSGCWRAGVPEPKRDCAGRINTGYPQGYGRPPLHRNIPTRPGKADASPNDFGQRRSWREPSDGLPRGRRSAGRLRGCHHDHWTQRQPEPGDGGSTPAHRRGPCSHAANQRSKPGDWRAVCRDAHLGACTDDPRRPHPAAQRVKASDLHSVHVSDQHGQISGGGHDEIFGLLEQKD